MTQQQRPPLKSERTSNRRTLRTYPRCPRKECDRQPDSLTTTRDGEYLTIWCRECGESGDERYIPARQEIETRPNPTLNIEEPRLTKYLKKYCDLRRRGCSAGAIRNRTQWPAHLPDLLLAEAQHRSMKGSEADPRHAYRLWLLEMHDSGMDTAEIYRLSNRSETETHEELTAILEIVMYTQLECWTTQQENYAEADAEWP